MNLVNQYKNILLEEYYMDENHVIRRKKNGYQNRFKVGDEASFHKGTGGYMYFQIPQNVRRTMLRSHLVWVLHGNELPEGMEIDHIDRIKTNDHILNLRAVSRKLNSRNRSRRSDNTSGITGIRWSDYHKHYVISRTIGSKRLSRSRKTLEAAIEVLEELKQMDSTYTESHGK